MDADILEGASEYIGGSDGAGELLELVLLHDELVLEVALVACDAYR